MPANSSIRAEIPEYLPLMLNNNLPINARLVLMVACSTIGTIMNGFFVAAFFIEKILRRRGYLYLASMGASDFIITAAVIPTCALVLLSKGQLDTIPLCNTMHFLGVASTYCYNLFAMLVATESCHRQLRTTEYTAFKKANGIISIFVFVLSFMVAAVGVYLEMDYNYCTRASYGNFYFRVGTAILFQVIPFLLTIFGLICASIALRRRARKKSTYTRSIAFDCDRSTTASNITAYLIFVNIWIPYLVIVYKYPNSTDPYFYNSVWIGLSRSIFTTSIYPLRDQIFKRAYARLFKYCCCKKPLSNSVKGRHRRRKVKYRTAHRDTRVDNDHILHQGINVYNPQYSSSSRQIITTELRSIVVGNKSIETLV